MNNCDKKILQIEKTKRVEFLLERQFVEQHLVGGYAAKAIWKGLFEAGRITMSYQMFLVHLRRYFPAAETTSTKNRKAKVSSEEAPGKPLTSESKGGPMRLKSQDRQLQGFNISTIGKEHLLEPYREENRNE